MVDLASILRQTDMQPVNCYVTLKLSWWDVYVDTDVGAEVWLVSRETLLLERKTPLVIGGTNNTFHCLKVTEQSPCKSQHISGSKNYNTWLI